MVITYTESPSLGSIIKGDFDIDSSTFKFTQGYSLYHAETNWNFVTGGALVSIYDRDCKRTGVKALEPQNPGWKAEFDVDGGDFSVETHCFAAGCLSNDKNIRAPQITLGDWAAENGVLWECEKDQSYIQGLDALH
jgi:hypothetical protein